MNLSLSLFFSPPLCVSVRTCVCMSVCSSRSNAVEAELAVEIFARIQPYVAGDNGSADRIGIITPYSQQREQIKRTLVQRFGNGGRTVSVDTVDSFQGQEKDVIIISCVRSTGDIGFLRQPKRLNVALTRAKYSLYVFFIFLSCCSPFFPFFFFLAYCSDHYCPLQSTQIVHCFFLHPHAVTMEESQPDHV